VIKNVLSHYTIINHHITGLVRRLGLQGVEASRISGHLTFMFPCIVTQYSKMTNKIQLCRIIYYSLAAVHVSSNIFAHHQEHLNCITVSGITHVYRCRLVSLECWNWRSKFHLSHNTSRQRHTCVIPEAAIQFRCFWWWAKISLETCRAAKE
jgi:hypothetical protein